MPQTLVPVRWSRLENRLASYSVVLGLVSVAIVFWRWIPLIGIVFSVGAIIVAIPAVVTGHVALQHARDLHGEGRALAVTGLLCGYFTVAFAIIMPLVTAVLLVLGAVSFAQDQFPDWLTTLKQVWNEL